MRGIQPVYSAERTRSQRGQGPTRFSGIPGSRMAHFLQESLPIINPMRLKVTRGLKSLPSTDVQVFNLPLIDLATRLMVWTLYIPQGIMAIRYLNHPFETWGRNIAAWLAGVAILLTAKHEKWGLNHGIFNQFMIAKNQTAFTPPPKSFGKRLATMFTQPGNVIRYFLYKNRPRYNYLELLKEAGANLKALGIKEKDLHKAVLQKSHWAKLDNNHRTLFDVYKNNLGKQAKQLKAVLASRPSKSGQKALRDMQQKMKALTRINHRISLFNYLSAAFMIALMCSLIGVYVQKAVMLFISPLDKPFEKLKRANPNATAKEMANAQKDTAIKKPAFSRHPQQALTLNQLTPQQFGILLQQAKQRQLGRREGP